MSKNHQEINFIDLKAQQLQIRSDIEKALLRVLDHGKYVAGPEVSQLESNLAEYCGAKHVLTCANGTDALTLVLLAKNIKAGDAVFVPSFTFASTAEVVAAIGATPIFVDVNKHDFNLNITSLAQAIKKAEKSGLAPKCIIAVDLFGLPADYDEISKIADEHGLWVLSDAAQSLGASFNGKQVGNLGFVTTTSFFPAKPLGCYGDGGCIFTDDDDLAEVIASLKSHGQGSQRNSYVRIGLNSRLDSFQAAILLEKLKIFPQELLHRQSVANTYTELLAKTIVTPKSVKNKTSAWAQYTVILPEDIDRNLVLEKLKTKNIPTAVYYAVPLHRQLAYQDYAKLSPELSNTNYLSKHVMSLPMDGYITVDKLQYIADNLNASLS